MTEKTKSDYPKYLTNEWHDTKKIMPPAETPEGYSLIGIDKFDSVNSIEWFEGRICNENKNPYKLVHWMLLSKPETKS